MRGAESGRQGRARVDRAARRAAWLVLALVALAGLLVVMLWIGWHAPWGRRLVLDRIERAAAKALPGGVQIGGLRFEGGGTLEIDGLVIRDVEGQEAVVAAHATLELSPGELLRRRLHVRRAALRGVRLRVRRLRAGRINLAALTAPKPSPAPHAPSIGEPGGWQVAVDDLLAEGAFRVEDLPDQAGGTVAGEVRLGGSLAWRSGRLDVELRGAEARLRWPAAGHVRLRGRAIVDGEPRLEGVTLQLDALGSALAALPALRRARIEGPVELRLDGQASTHRAEGRLALRLAGGRIHGGLSARRGVEVAWQWRGEASAEGLDPGSVRVGPRRRLPEGRVDGRVLASGRGSSWRVAFDHLSARTSAGRIAASGQLRSDGTLAVQASADTARAEVAGRALGSRVPAVAHGQARLEVALSRRGRGPLGIDGWLNARDLWLPGAHLGGVRAEAHLVGWRGHASLRGRHLVLGPLRLDRVRGDLDGDRRQLRLDLDAVGPDEQLAVGVRARPVRDGRGFEGAVDRLRLLLGGQGWEATQPAALRVSPEAIAVRGLRARSAEQSLVLDAAWRGGREPSLQARVGLHRVDAGRILERLRPGSLARLPSALSPLLLDGEADLRGPLRQPEADLSFTLAAGQDRATSARLGGTAGYHAGRASAAATLDLDGARLLEATGALASDPSMLLPVLRGRARPDGAIEAKVTVPGYDLARLRTLPRVPSDLAGRLTATATVTGTLQVPRGEGRLEVDGLATAGGCWERVLVEGRADGEEVRGRMTVGRAAATSPGAGGHEQPALVIDGSYHRPDGLLRASLRAEGFPLAPLGSLPGAMAVTAGLLDADLTLTGRPRAPSIRGRLDIRDGAFAIRSEGHRYTGVTMRALLAPVAEGVTEVLLPSLVVHSGDGVARGQGSLQLDGLRPRRLDLRVVAERFGLTLGGTVVTRVNGHLHAIGATRNGALEGHVLVEQGGLELPAIASGRKLQPVGPLDDVEFVDPAGRREARRARKGGTPLPILVDVSAPGGVAVKGPDVRSEVAGSIRLVARGPSLTLAGRLHADGGVLELLDKRFRIEHARFDFAGREPIDPDVDVRLRRQVGDVTVLVDVTGTVRRPRVALSSDPPRYDESELLALVISGDPQSGPVDSATLDRSVVGALSGLVARRLKDNLLPGLPVDVLRVEVGAVPTSVGSVQTTRVEVGKYLTNRIYVSYVHQFVSSPQTLERVNANQATVEWRFARRFELDTTYGDAGVGGVDFAFRYRF